MWVRSLGQKDPQEKEMATHSSILAWRIPRAEESVGVQSIRSQSWTRLNLVWHTHKSICQGLTATTTNGISHPPLWRLNPGSC